MKTRGEGGYSGMGVGCKYKWEPPHLIKKFKNLKILKNLTNAPGLYSKQYSNNKANKDK